MKKTTSFREQLCQKQPFITRQDVLHILVLLTIALVFSLVPTRSFGQPTPGNIIPNAISQFDQFSPSAVAAAPAPSIVPATAPEATVPRTSTSMEDFNAPSQQQQYQQQYQSAVPVPAEATAVPLTASQYQSPPARSRHYQSAQQQRPLQRELAQRELAQHEVAVSAEHPFRQYWGEAIDPQTKIAGKPMTVAQLFAGTRSSSARYQLLQAYWELSGLLAIYHFRCETERQAIGASGAQQDGMTALLGEQRRTAEMEFIKQQWVLAELVKQSKGRMIQESELPIPVDYPLYPRYQTFADKIARSDRTQYLGRMIPIQEQLIESKNGTWKAASQMTQSASQPFFMVMNQRTAAFLDLTAAIVEYNKMIAEYALETIPPNVSQQQLVGAVVRQSGGNASPPQPQPSQMATGVITLSQYVAPVSVTAQPIEQVAYEYQPPPTPSILDEILPSNDSDSDVEGQ
jgi:hypothetical protein